MLVTFLAAAKGVFSLLQPRTALLCHKILLEISLQLNWWENREFLTFTHNGVLYFNINFAKYFFHQFKHVTIKQANPMPLSMSELIKTHQSEPAAAQSTTSWRAERRRLREYRGPEKPRSARASTTMAPSNTHAYIYTGSRMFGYHSNTHTLHQEAWSWLLRRGSQLIMIPIQVSVSFFTLFVVFGSVFEGKD